MGRIYEALVRFFKEDNWNAQVLEDKHALRMGFQGKNGRWECIARAREEERQIIFYSIIDVFAPEDKRHLVAELLTRANFGMIIGNFEMDFSDGELRFKTSLDVEGGEEFLGSPIIRQLVYANVTMMDRYFPAIMNVIYGGLTPEEAVARVEEVR